MEKSDEKQNAEIVSQQGENAQVANEQGESVKSETNAQVAEVQTQEPMLPKSRFDEVNQRMQKSEQEAALLRQQIEILSRQQSQGQPQQKEPLRKQVIKRLGLENEVYLTVEQQIAVDEQVDQIRQQQMMAQNFYQSHTDFTEIVGSVNPVTGQFVASDYLRDAIRNHPELTGLDTMVVNNPGAASYAYSVAKMAKMLKELQGTSQVSQQSLQAVQNQQNLINKMSPMSSGGGAISSDLSSKVANMTDAQFQQHLADVRSGKYDKPKG